MTRRTQAKSQSAPTITRSAASALIEAVLATADEISFPVAVAVTDTGGHLKAFERTDDAPFLAAEVAVDKAWTAVSYRVATHVWNSYVTDPHVAPLAHHPRLMAVGGGYPIIESGTVVGGLGVSGGSYEQDRQAAEAALDMLGFDIPA
ncbi:GlcG/HbpS family heme-binding protein [Embleya scabrispora]|uniref:GlcG/HbpS family heme-binding protein n=1 Tax=Embleya scabrispora TaxID=159449 RepID=UPI00037846BE|nr:heme-binding protein [Embleya scabrispora]MYS85771.1 heme-binding protein [Streptomyces sp. SID5474]